MKSTPTPMVIFQNYFSPYRHKLFQEIARKVELTVVYMQKPQEEGRKWEEELFGADKTYTSFQLRNLRLFPIKPFSQIVWVTGIRRLVKSISPNATVVFLDNMPTNLTMLRIVSALSRKIPRSRRVLWNEHILPSGSDSKYKNYYKKAMTFLLSLRVDTILSFSAMTNDYLEALKLPLKGQALVRTFQTTYTSQEIEQYHNQVLKMKPLGQKQLTFGFLGYFSKRKGIEELLKAIKFYRNPEAHFLFIGTGPSESDILKAAKQDPRIVIKPYAVTEEEKTARFSEMSVHVVASEKDPWCVVVNEAACRGVPSLVSPNVGAKEFIALIDKSLILPDNNAISLVKAFTTVAKTFEKKEKWQQLREKTFKMSSLWNIEQAAEAFVELTRS